MKFLGIICTRVESIGLVHMTREFDDLDHFASWAAEGDSDIQWGKVLLCETGEQIGELRVARNIEQLLNMPIPAEAVEEILQALVDEFGEIDPGFQNHYRCPVCTEIWSTYARKKGVCDCPKCDATHVFPSNSTECDLNDLPDGATVTG